MNETTPEIDITPGLETGTYRIFTRYSKDLVATTAQGMLDIAAWVELHRDQLNKESGHEIVRYRVTLRNSRVVPVHKHVEFPVDAINAQEAASRALLQYGAQTMAFVDVMSAAKTETFHSVELQPDHSITFASLQETLRPQPPFAPLFDPDQPGGN